MQVKSAFPAGERSPDCPDCNFTFILSKVLLDMISVARLERDSFSEDNELSDDVGNSYVLCNRSACMCRFIHKEYQTNLF